MGGQQITTAMLYSKPSIKIANAGNFSLEVEVDLFNDHIEWLVAKGDVYIFTSFDWVTAIEKFCEVIGDIDIDVYI